jgi:signal transduction histidine kinase
VTDFLIGELGQWPGRFRSAELVRILAARSVLDAGLAAEAVLSGLIEEHDERQVFASLLAAGDFEVAQWMLGQCPVFDDAEKSERARHQLNAARIDSQQAFTARLRELSDWADRAGLPVEGGLEEALEELCLTSRTLAEKRLAAVERRLAADIEAKMAVLRTRLAATDDFDPGYVEEIEALIDTGHLRAAERILDGTATEQLPGPQGVRRVQSLEWKAPAEEILRWNLENDGPASFRAVVEPQARALLTAYRELQHGGETNAQVFARALDAFLSDSGLTASRVTQQGEVFFTDLHHVFFDPQTTRFSRRQRVRLLVAGPGVAVIPDSLVDQLPHPFIAVGPSLTRPTPGGRRTAAVVTLDDLLRLVRIKNRRPVALLRIIGRQWPIWALSGETAEELERLLGPDEQERWLTLTWLVDLCGLGDTTVADAIAFETGLDSGLVRVFLDYLDRRQAPGMPDSGVMRDIARGWHADKQMFGAVEDVVRSRLRSGQDVAVAFWAALATAPLGVRITMLELALTAEGAAPVNQGADSDVQVNWEEEVAVGAAELEKLWLVSSAAANADRLITLRECGAYGRLAVNARDRLREACENRAEQLRQANRESKRGLDRLVQAAHRHALLRLRNEYENVRRDPFTPQEVIDAKRKALDDELACVLDADGMTGPSDLGEVLKAMIDGFHKAYQNVSITVEGTPKVTVAVGRVLIWAVLDELFANAAQALTELGGGEIEVDVEYDDTEVLVHIRDGGDGIHAEVQHKIFRDGISTHSGNRGFGLYNARRIADRVGGALELAEPRGRDVQLRGAHFLLNVPRQ